MNAGNCLFALHCLLCCVHRDWSVGNYLNGPLCSLAITSFLWCGCSGACFPGSNLLCFSYSFISVTKCFEHSKYVSAMNT